MGKTSQTLVSYSPSTEQAVWTGSYSDEKQISEAIRLARISQVSWDETGIDYRKAIIKRFAELVKENTEDGARVISEENGKPLWEAKTEVNSLINKVQAVFDAYDERAQTKSKEVNGRLSVTRYRPHGVFAVLGPYNFPMSMPNSHIMPALLAGNTVIFKPSERTPKSAEYYMSLWRRAGLPENVMSVIHGGGEIGEILVSHPEINGVLFIGSRAVGVDIEKKLATSTDKIRALEMGGNSPLIIWDYDDIRTAVHIAIQSAYISSGQRCSAARRLILNKNKAEEYIPHLKKAIQGIVVGSPFDNDPTPFMGPLIDQKAVVKFFADYEALIAQGAQIIVPAERIPGLGRNFVRPSLLDVTGLNVQDHEIFGPLLQLIIVDDLEHAIIEANKTQFGLAAGIVTTNRSDYELFFKSTKAGIINWNQPLTGATTAAPFGGVKASGNYRPAGYLSVDYCSYACASIEESDTKIPTILPPGLNY